MRHTAVIVQCLVLWALLPAALLGRDITVEPGSQMSSIGQAVAIAQSGDRILVRPGLYLEDTIVIDRPLTIEGVGWPVVDAQGLQAFTVTANHVTIRGLVIRNVAVSFVEDRAGIKVDDARDCTIEDNRLENTFFGIYLAKSSDCTVRRNVIEGPARTETQSGNGIHLWYSRDVAVEDNTISGHRDGIYFEFVEDGRINRNLSTANVRYGLHFMFSDRCRYEGNRFLDNGAGVAVMYTEDVVMFDNVFEGSWGGSSYGLLLKDITDSHISRNLFRGNSTGLYAEGVSRITVERNDFEENGWAIRIMANSIENTFTRNNFAGNTFDVATNSRNNFSTFVGNYWDDYSGYDLDRDGYGDVPFRPVRLFSQVVQTNEPALMLLRSFFVSILDFTERIIPILTPDTLVDSQPVMRRIQ